MIAAMSQEKVVASQVIEGGVDANVFENFLYELLKSLRNNEETKSRDILIFMDNATIHHHQMVLRTAQRFKVHVLFNAEYSPQLNPIELLFTLLKREARRHVEEIETR